MIRILPIQAILSVSPTQFTVSNSLTLTTSCLLIDASHFARRHKSDKVEVKHMLVALTGQFHGFGGVILRDLLREQHRGQDLWAELQKHDPIKASVQLATNNTTSSEQLEWVLQEAAYIAEDNKEKSIGTGEVLLAVARLIKKPNQSDFPSEVQNPANFQGRTFHTAKKFIFHREPTHIREIDITQKLLGLAPEELEGKISCMLKRALEGYRFYKLC